MKETKVYVDELPKSCAECEHCTKHHKDNYGIPYCLIARMPLYNGDKINEERGQHKDSLSDFDCPLTDIKTHDRELVKEVCEKISIELENETETYCEIRQCTSPHYQGDYVWFNYVKFRKFIDQLQKEFENGDIDK